MIRSFSDNLKYKNSQGETKEAVMLYGSIGPDTVSININYPDAALAQANAADVQPKIAAFMAFVSNEAMKEGHLPLV